MKFKRIMSIATCALMSMSILTGCAANEKSVSKDGITTLKWYTIGGEPKDYKQVMEKVNAYLGERIGVNLDMTFTDFGDYNQKMSVVVNSGENFDLAFTCSWAGDYLGNSRKGAFLELDPYLDTLGKEMKATID